MENLDSLCIQCCNLGIKESQSHLQIPSELLESVRWLELTGLKGVLTRFWKITKGTYFVSLVCNVNALHTAEPGNTYKIFYFDFKVFVAEHLHASPTAMDIIPTSQVSS
uniref:Uncharacterized protein n=1 Tax=Rhipicephalus zambeziensis TaxID=60191 RepID=A0A224YJU9_9ACAR